ncbi:MAG: protein-glutamate O-methyltransferase family protein [Oscillatoria sp. SIO1A7]|nr:protein-glutamate O-methyltransferase family protein [Oscillatoria sp. SIO1A7]
MSTYPKTSLPIPPQIRGGDRVGSWAYNTMDSRLSALCRRIIDENGFSGAIADNLEALARDLPEGKIRKIKNLLPAEEWDDYVEPYLGKDWLDIPWYFAEAYFYRRVLEATDYFSNGRDPFAAQKLMGIEGSIASMRKASYLVNNLPLRELNNVVTLAYLSLWGNKADLSLWPASSGDRSQVETDGDRANLLADDTPQLLELLAESQGKRIDFIIDNAGFELFCDLCLADYLLTSKVSAEIHFHVKAHPTFVSDAIAKDVRHLVDFFTSEAPMVSENREVHSLATRLQDHLAAGRLQLRDNLFWNSPLVFWQMPDELRQELAKASLIIVKGDANYRRILGDCYWPFTTPFEEIANYFPAPLLALRTMKAELACGLSPGQAEALDAQDPDWLTNGQRGVVQLARPFSA